MAPGSDHDRDDNGLPPVEVAIPDDPSELDREITAYRREQRQRRRQERWQRLSRPFRRYGLLLPLIAVSLTMAIVAVLLITLLGPEPPRQPARRQLAVRGTADPGEVGGLLPAAIVRDDDREAVRLRDLRPGVIMIIPEGCRCGPAVDHLTRQSREFLFNVYLVSAASPPEDLRRLASREGHGVARVLGDEKGVLAGAYRPAGLTAVLVHTDGVVGGVLRNVSPGVRLESTLDRLQRPGQGAPAQSGAG
ncbi:MAG: hypothetical protein GEV11_23700 [Streptosporangiales bacterium]|nr:hypothetical protein [Streptosporangiales bacterium]